MGIDMKRARVNLLAEQRTRYDRYSPVHDDGQKAVHSLRCFDLSHLSSSFRVDEILENN